jgi:hypothetical protein
MHLTKFFGLLTLFSLSQFVVFAQTTSKNEKRENRCLRLNGKDDYVNFGDIYRDLELPVTVSAWINIDPQNIQLAPVFASRNCRTVYSGFILVVDRNYMFAQYGDGYGMKHHAFRRGKEARVKLPHGEWHHVAAVIQDNTKIDLYLDGVNAGGELSGTSSNLMGSDTPNGFASVGYLLSNDEEYRFKGGLDDVRVWNRALSPEEVKNSMCNTLTGKETGLIGHWTFDEASGKVCNDKSPNKFNGTMVGSAQRETAAISCVK